MKVVRILGLLFGVVGLVLLLISVVVYNHSKAFLEKSVVTEGTVIALDLDYSTSSRSTSTSTSSGVYYPIVSFKTAKGETIEFRSNFGSRPPAYSKGERVPVRYDPSDPYRARIDSFASLWVGVIVLVGLGSVFGIAGVIMTVVPIVSARRDKWLQEFGQAITTEFQSVELNTSVRVNGQSPYRIVSQWQDPVTNEVHVFRSKNIWFNPEEFITGSEIRVLIDPNNPKRYLMDTSFLPERAD